MSFTWDSTGIDPDDLLPEGKWMPFKIVEAEELTSKKGNAMVKVTAEVFNHDQYNGKRLWHYVTFIPKGNPGDGINVQFRKCIGVPFGGNDEVDAADWIGKRFMGKIAHEDNEGQRNHKIKSVSPMKDQGSAQEGATVGEMNKDSDIPF